jgi:hypothetical protein
MTPESEERLRVARERIDHYRRLRVEVAGLREELNLLCQAGRPAPSPAEWARILWDWHDRLNQLP